MKPTRHPAVPKFASGFLDGVADAVGRRAHAIKHRAFHFGCTREQDGPNERMNLDVKLLDTPATTARVSLWSDGAMWLGVNKPASSHQGWSFVFAASGRADVLSAEQIVANFEQTLGIADSAQRSCSEADIMDAWSDVDLTRER